MRWEMLFADLEARLEAAQRADLEAEIADRARSERADVTLGARVVGMRGAVLTVVLRGGRRVSGTVADAAATWLLLASGGGEVLVPASAIAAIEGLGHGAASLSAVERRLGMGSVLRELADARADVVVDTDAGAWRGRILAVGADHLDLDGPGGVRAIPLAAVLAVAAAG